MGYKSLEAKREYQRKWMQNRRNQCINYLGGKCIDCGETKNLEFDHVDPTKKIVSINRILSYNLNTLYKELDFCVLRCNECHKRKTRILDIKSRQLVHGSSASYKVCGPPKCIKCKNYQNNRLYLYRNGLV